MDDTYAEEDISRYNTDEKLVNIYEIKIMMRTNIPDFDIIPLTKGLLHNPLLTSLTDFNEYPYFTPDILYPTNYLNTLSYTDKIGFFFNRAKFSQILQTKGIQYPCKNINMNLEEFDEIYSESNDVNHYSNLKISSCNIEIMLTLIFPTSFPDINKHENSFTQYIQQQRKPTSTSGILPRYIQNIISNTPPTAYSYLNINGAIYTVSGTIWLNDIVNHPLYRKMINNYIEFNKWRTIMFNTLTRKKDMIDTLIYRTITLTSVDKTNLISNLMNMRIDMYKDLKKNMIEDQKKNMIDNNEYAYIDALFVNIIKLFKLKTQDNIRLIEAIIPYNITNVDMEKDDDKSTVSELNVTELNNIIITVQDTLDDIMGIVQQMATMGNEYKLPNFINRLVNKLINMINDKIDINELLVSSFSPKFVNMGYMLDINIPDKYKNNTYEPYNIYINSIQEYIYPSRVTINDHLQEMITDFHDNINKHMNYYIRYIIQKYYMNSPTVKFSNFIPTNTKFKFLKNYSSAPFFIGVCKLEDTVPVYEVYVQVNVIGGEVNDNNSRSISCKYTDSLLGDKLLKYENISLSQNKWTVDPNPFHYILPLPLPLPPPAISDIPIPEIAGGKKGLRNRRKSKRINRKKYTIRSCRRVRTRRNI